VPSYANPQNLNRYSYVTNNPLRYTDPTGHMLDPYDGGGGCNSLSCFPQVPNNPPGGGGGNGDQGNGDDGNITDDLISILDQLAWDYIPSAVGVHGNITWNFGGGIEGNFTPMELMLLANWRSGEISLMVSMAGSGMLTVPDLVGVSLNGGITEVYGASSNIRLEGWSDFLGGSISVGEGLNLGASRSYGNGRQSFSGGDYIDPVSNRNVRFRQSAIFGSATIPIIPTPVDGSVFYGKSYTREVIRISFPSWPLR